MLSMKSSRRFCSSSVSRRGRRLRAGLSIARLLIEFEFRMFDVVEELLVVSRANKGLVGRSMLLGFLFSEAGGVGIN